MTEPVADAPDVEHVDETETPLARAHAAMATLKAAGDTGASWFYWIAVLSLVNTAITHSGGDHHFIVGLAITFVVDVVANEIGKKTPELVTILMVIAIGFSVFVSAMAGLFGWLSRKRVLWVFGVGMALYVLDGLIHLLVGDYLSAGFHGYVLFAMIRGFTSYRKLKRLEDVIENASAVDTTVGHHTESAQNMS